MRSLIIAVSIAVALLAISLAAAAAWLDGDRLRALAVRYVEQRRDISLEIDSVERSIGLVPRVELEGLRLHDARFTASPLLQIERAAFRIDLRSLLFGPAELSDVVVESPRVVLPVTDGGLRYWPGAVQRLMQALKRVEWSFHDFRLVDGTVEARHVSRDASAQMTVASIEGSMPRPDELTFRVADVGGNLSAPAVSATTWRVRVDEARLSRADAELPVRLTLDGSVGGRALSIRASGGNVLVGEPEARKSLDASATLGASEARVDGTISRAAGADLDVAVGVEALGGLPPSSASFGLRGETGTWFLEGLSLEAGGTRLSGELRLERQGERPLLAGALTLSGLELGGRSAATAGSNAASDTSSRRGRAFAAYEFAVERLDAIDAMLELEARDVGIMAMRVSSASAELGLADGRLEIAPVRLRTQAGSSEASLTLGGDERAPRLGFTASFEGLDAETLAAELGVASKVSGMLEGRIELESAGTNAAALVEGLEGRATMLMSNGAVSEALARFADLELVRAFFARLGDEDMTPVHCAIADFDGTGGVFESRTLIFDTGTVKLVGQGEADLPDRRIDFVVGAYSNDFSLLKEQPPLRIAGPWRNPSIVFDADEASTPEVLELDAAQGDSCRRLLERARRTTP